MVVSVAFSVAQLCHSQELEVESQDAALGQVDATPLLERCSFPFSVMAIDVDDDRNFSRELPRFVQQAGDPQVGYGFIGEFSNAIVRSSLEPLEPSDV